MCCRPQADDHGAIVSPLRALERKTRYSGAHAQVRLSPSGTACCSHRREPVVNVSIIVKPRTGRQGTA